VYQQEQQKPGYCIKSSDGTRCKRSRLLFPTQNKDYNADPFIKDSWDKFRANLPKCFMFTIFGYSAPKSDIVALNAIREVFLVSFFTV
jgi:hypothetical protein